MTAIIITNASAKEIAALASAVQERQQQKIVIKGDAGAKTPERAKLASTIRGVLLEVAEQSQSQQPEATERIQNQDAASHSEGTAP